MAERMRVAMVGVGGFGGYRRSRMRETGLFQIVACLDRSPEILTRACEQEQARACSTLDQLLATPGIEGVVISTGADSHAALGIAAMEAGLHVFIEKPLCCSVQEVQDLRATAARTGRVVGVGHSDNKTDVVNLLVHQYMNNGKLGTVATYEKNTSHSGGLEIKPGDWRGLADRNPGGMLFQCGVHALHSLVDLFGPIASVQAMMRYDANPNTQTADVANVLIRHESGMVGTLNCYHITGYCHEIRVFGTVGNLYVDTHTKTAMYQQRKRNEVEVREPVEMPTAPANASTSNLINWHHAVRAGGRALPGLDDGINAVLPVFAAELAGQQGREISLRELLQPTGVA